MMQTLAGSHFDKLEKFAKEGKDFWLFSSSEN
jgi:hypothetical protein